MYARWYQRTIFGANSIAPEQEVAAEHNGYDWKYVAHRKKRPRRQFPAVL